jgi:hypothetical protein
VHSQRDTLQRTEHDELLARGCKTAREREDPDERDTEKLDGASADDVSNGSGDQQTGAGSEAVD